MTTGSMDAAGSPGAPAADEAAWAELADLVLRVAREIQFRGYVAPEAIGLSTSEGMVMRQLHREAGLNPTDIAAATGIQRTNLSAVLRGLESKGLIERRQDPADRRIVGVSVTDRGAANYRLVKREWASAIRPPDGSASRAQIENAVGLLASIEKNLVSSRPAIAGGRPKN